MGLREKQLRYVVKAPLLRGLCGYGLGRLGVSAGKRRVLAERGD